MVGEPETISAQTAISLRPVTADTVRAICRLDVTEEQKHYVAPNAVSIAQAYFEPKAWFRAIYADETPVGFIMLYDDPAVPEYLLWRFMIDARYQKLGFGRGAMDLVVEYVRSRPAAKELLLTCVPGEDGPQPFYRKFGFKNTGKMCGDEAEMRIDL